VHVRGLSLELQKRVVERCQAVAMGHEAILAARKKVWVLQAKTIF
jgi:hypothetical protein